jgi:uncharacterized protein
MSEVSIEKQNTVLNVNKMVIVHLILACFLAILIIPVFIFTDAEAAAMAAIKASGIVDIGPTYFDAVRVSHAVPGAIPAVLLLLLQPWTPSIAAFLLCIFVIKRGSAADLLSRFKPWRGVTWQHALISWALAFGVAVILCLLRALARYYLLPEASFEWLMPDFGPTFWMTLFATMFFDGGGLAEEAGWRGFAAPLLLSKYSPLKAAIILGVIWSAWHIPVKFDELFSGFAKFAVFYLNFTFFTICLTIIIMYFSNRVGGSALMGVMLHGMSNDAIRLSGRIPNLNILSTNADPGIISLYIYGGTIGTMIVAIVLVVISKGTLAFTPQAAAPYVDSTGKFKAGTE